MSRELTTTCPSGLTVRLRSLKGQEINTFANKSEAQQQQIAYDLLKSLVVEVTDPGPLYSTPIDWKQVIVADRFWLYLQMRVATYGDDYIFRYQCGVSNCRKRFEWGLKLSQLPFQPLPQESLDTFKAGNVFGPINVGGEDVTFQLLTGELEDKGIRMQNQLPDDAATVAIANRIRSVGGREGRGKIHEWVKELDMMDLMDLVDAMDEHDGGVETKIEIECPKCKTGQEVNLPLGEDYWTPDKRLRSLARKGAVTDEPGGGPIRQTSD